MCLRIADLVAPLQTTAVTNEDRWWQRSIELLTSRGDEDSPEVTAEQFARARPIAEVWPADLIHDVMAQQRRRRGPQKAPTKQMISVRLDPDTLAAYKATGRGWQSRMGDDLARAAKRLKKATA